MLFRLKFTKAKQIDEEFHAVMIIMSQTPKYVVTEDRLKDIATKTKQPKTMKKKQKKKNERKERKYFVGEKKCWKKKRDENCFASLQ